MDKEKTQLKFLLDNACLRSAPTEPSQLFGGSNSKTGNVAYMHAEDLRKLFPAEKFPDEGLINIDTGMGFSCRVVLVPLMQKGGVIFAKFNEAFK